MYKCLYLNIWKIGLVIVFSLICNPIVVASPRCPYKCKCSITSINCADKELTEVPDLNKITPEPTTIDLSKNDIEEVTNINFNSKKLEKLVTLKLNDNIIFDIQVKAFSTLLKLIYLDLSNNLMEDFQEEIINSNKELKELKLSGNLFGSNTPQLKSDSLEVLDLSFTKLSHFTKANVAGLPNLRLLYLQANNLVDFEYTILAPNIKYIDLSFNAWKCQCKTIKLFDYLVANNLTTITTPVQCSQPYRRYEDVYDSNGPVRIAKWCGKPLHPPTITVPTITSEDTCFDLKVWLWIAITFVVLVVTVSSVIIYRKYSRPKPKILSKRTLYSEVPTKLETDAVKSDFKRSDGKEMV